MRRIVWLLPALWIGALACRGPAGVPTEPLQPLATRATPVPEEPDHAAHDLAAAALAGAPDDARAALARLESVESLRRAAGAAPSGLSAWGQHLVDATAEDPVVRRRAAEQLLERDELDPALHRQLELEVADDPLTLADKRIFDSRRARVARGVNAFAEAAGRSITSTVMAPFRFAQAAIGVAVAEHMDEPISVQERQALGYWKQYVETHPGSPETPRLLGRIEGMQQRWFSMKRERSVRAARLALEQHSDDIALVLASRALAYAPEDDEATDLFREARRRVDARRANHARSLQAAPDGPPDARAGALARALLDPDGDVEGAARAVLEANEEGSAGDADAARFALALAADERGDEERAEQLLERVADADDAGHPMARHARQLLDDPDSNPYGAFRRARVEHVEDQATFVLLGPLARGVRDRDLPTPVEWLLEGPTLVSTLGGIPSRLVQTAVAGKPDRAPAVYAQRYLALRPDGAHAPELRAWLVDHYRDLGDAVRAQAVARDMPHFDPEDMAELEQESAEQMLKAARRQNRRDMRLAMLSEVARRHPDTEAGREAADEAASELEEATAQSIRISRGFLVENPRVAGPQGLDLKPELLDERIDNGELHPEGVRLVGGRFVEFALVAPSGDEDDEPTRIQRHVSEDRLARLVAVLEETAARNALLDPLAEQAPDSRRDLFFERARLGLADHPDPRPTATSSFAFLGVRERYGMVRQRESILPVEFVIQGSFPDLGFGAFPRLRMPKTTPDAFLYR